MSDTPPSFGNNFLDVESLRRWRRERRDDDAPMPPRFSLLALMGLSTGAAVYCGLLRLLGVYGVMLMLAGLVALRLFRVADRWRPVKRVVADMLAGIVLPIGCLAFDPGVFRTNGGGAGPFSLADQMAIYTLLGTEMLVLFVWLLVGGAFNSFARGITAGVLTLGSLICIALGIVLGLLGLGGILIREPIGLLGFVPCFTLVAFMGNARRTKLSSGDQRGVVAGALLGIVLPLTLATVVGVGTWIVAPHAAAIPGASWEKLLMHQNHLGL